MNDSSAQMYYAQPGLMTAADPYTQALQSLPADLPGQVAAVQNLNVHIFWSQRMGLELSEARQAEVQLRPLTSRIARLLELDPSPLSAPRPLEQRLVSNCRDFSLFLTGLLRAQSRPARARCGFGVYFLPDHFEDHWVVEVWDPARSGWVWVDSQINDLMSQVLQLDFDPLDMPPGQFVTGGQAWLMCRQGQADPDQFGIFEYHGWDFVRGNLVRDLLALNKIEVLPWDFWGLLTGKPVAECTPDELARLDHLAELTLQPEENFTALQAAYQTAPDLQIPPEWALQHSPDKAP